MSTEDIQPESSEGSSSAIRVDPSAARSLSAAQIRKLRGSLSRASFAGRLSVTPLTVYRWELPDSASEARRPRGRMLERLRAYAAAPRWASEPPERHVHTRLDGGAIARLFMPIQRVSVRGMSPALIQRELVAVLGELFPSATVRLEEIDSHGTALLLARVEGASAGTRESVELGDGCGRRLRVSIAGRLADSAQHVLTTIAGVAALALEVATLRGFGEQRGPNGKTADALTELPGSPIKSSAAL